MMWKLPFVSTVFVVCVLSAANGVVGGESVVVHEPLTVGPRLVPIPFYVEIKDDRAVGAVVLYYRTLGESIYQQVPLRRFGRGYAAVIGCDVLQTFDPVAIEYYIAVFAPDGSLVATSGTEARPHSYVFDDKVFDDKVFDDKVFDDKGAAQPASLPGEKPPRRCLDDCPPWNPDCKQDCLLPGTTCRDTSECCSGSVCVGGVCDDSTERRALAGQAPYVPFVTIFLNFGTGLGFLAGSSEDPYNKQTSITTDLPAGTAHSRLHGRLGVAFSVAKDLEIGATFRGDFVLGEEHLEYLPAIMPAGLFNLWYTLAQTQPKGVSLKLLLGVGGGYLLHYAPYFECDENLEHCDASVADVKRGFYRKAGPFLVEMGIDAYYWFARRFGLNFGVVADLAAPNFALNFDFQVGVAFRY